MKLKKQNGEAYKMRCMHAWVWHTYATLDSIMGTLDGIFLFCIFYFGVW